MRFALLLLLVVGASAQATKPYLRIETGAHAAVVRRIDVDSAERFLVSASDDKTARVWDLHSGRLLKILRPPIGDGNEGRLYAVGISPDGATVAVGGFTGADGSGNYPIYLFDRESGAIRKAITGVPNATKHLAYSKDGRYLAAALGGKDGIRIFDTAKYSEAARDVAYGDNSYWVEFDKAGRLVATSYDGFVRLYDSNFRLMAKAKTAGGRDPFSARFSPDGKRIAVGFSDDIAVDIISGVDLSLEYPLRTPSGPGGLSGALWSTEGKDVCAAGTYGPSSVIPVLCWDDRGKGRQSAFPVAGTTVMGIRALRDGAIAFCVADGSVGVLSRGGTIAWRSSPDLLAYRGGPSFPHLSADGDKVEARSYYFDGTTWTSRTISFSLSGQKVEIDSAADPSLNGTLTSGLAVANWQYNDHPTLDGRALQLEAYEFSRSLAIAPGKHSLVLGAEWSLRKFDESGKQVWRTSVPGAAWGVNISSDSRFVVATLGDGTIRWYTLEEGEEVLAVFIDRDLKRWVAWNPDGFFSFQGGGDGLIGYQINRGPEQEGEFVKVDQLREVFYQPDLIAQILKPESATALAAARKRLGDISQILAGGLPPEIELIS
jgi:WD40 repeat protein